MKFLHSHRSGDPSPANDMSFRIILTLASLQIVEELEDRLGDKMQDILDTVQASLGDVVSSVESTEIQYEETYNEQPSQVAFSAEDVEGWADEQEFVHEDGNMEDAIGDIDDDVE